MAHTPPAQTARKILNEYATDSPPQFILGFVPFIALAIICIMMRRLPPARLAWLSLGGLLGVLGLTVFLYTVFWFPYYSPGATPDANAPIALIFFPFYCICGMAGGMSLGWLGSRVLPRPPGLPATDLSGDQ
ncbi:hypothetical protein [Luteolibacter luteus]|uniref:Uncharacterized protein n=1 Tax=Luteolibacter luteus TaxID=2728835 RepID=A0A858RHH1_9BACT|nr:hypothetical protein [Luteolibacter luteus]QJE96155.1 hypothetical protein HHL09_10280 [Luteolibacter luteus]